MIGVPHRCLVVTCLIAVLVLAACGRASVPAAGPQAAIELGRFPSSMPAAIALNTVTNKIYVAEPNTGSISVIDGVTNVTGTVATGGVPEGLTVNPVTNRIYVTEGPQVQSSGGPGPAAPLIQQADGIRVIDGATNMTTVVHLGAGVRDVAVDTANGKAYVSESGGRLTVIDPTGNATSTVAVGQAFGGPVVNPVTHKVYISTRTGLVAVDGASNATATLSAPVPGAVAVDPSINRIYASDGATLNVIDAATGATIARVAVGESDYGGIAVNSKTHKIYVLHANYPNPGTVTVVDGRTFGTARVRVGRSPTGIRVDESANAAYVVDGDSDDIVRIDGATNAARTASVPRTLSLLALNPTTGKVYVVSGGPRAGLVSGLAPSPTNVSPPPYVLDVFDFNRGHLPNGQLDTCYPSPPPGATVARGECRN